MRLGKFRPLQQAGDTIVEVLIVVIIMGVVVSAGYRIAVRSLQSTQLAQEKSYALKLAEGQLETFKAAIDQDPAIIGTTDFCLTTDSNGVIVRNPIASSSPADTMDGENYANYPNACKKDPNGGSCTGLCYYFGIRKVGGASNNFTASVRWDGPRGNKQQVELSYRVYQ